jgi:hypothetical protein
MENKLIISYVLNIFDMIILLCFFNDADMSKYGLIRPCFDSVFAFVFAKVVLVAISLWCTFLSYKHNRCAEVYFKIKSWVWIFIYSFLVIYDIAIIMIGGSI